MTEPIMTDTPFLSAADKRLVLKQWRVFLRALDASLDAEAADTVSSDHGEVPAALVKPFTARLYSHLTGSCAFIAHFSRHGFLAHYFNDPADTRRFLTQFDGRGPHESIEYGGNWIYGAYADINQAMVDACTSLMPRLEAKLASAIRSRDLAIAELLARHHGMRLVPVEPGKEQNAT